MEKQNLELIQAEAKAAKLYRQLQKAKGERSDLEKRLKITAAELNELEQAYSVQAGSSDYEDPSPIPVVEKKRPNTCVPIIAYSDWHMEEYVNPAEVNYLNEYNPDIAVARAKATVSNTIKMLRHTRDQVKFSEVFLWLGGDFMTGVIHGELQDTNTMPPVDAARLVKKTLESAIGSILEERYIKKLRICAQPGNHGRMTEKGRFKTYTGYNHETGIYWDLRDRIKSKRVEWHIPDSVVAYTNLTEDFCARTFHGQEVRYSRAFGGLAGPAARFAFEQDKTTKADLNIFGHFHTLCYPLAHIIANSALIGYNEMSIKFGFAYQPPMQSFSLLDVERRIVRGHNPIFAE